VVPAAAPDALPNHSPLAAASSSSSAVLDNHVSASDAYSGLHVTEAALDAPSSATAAAAAAAAVGHSSSGQRSKQLSRPAGVGKEPAAFFHSRPGPKLQRRPRNRSPRPQRHVREAMQQQFSLILQVCVTKSDRL
jgi:hypothetical protein